MSALSIATETIKQKWEALGYRVEISPSQPFAAEIEIYDGNAHLDTITILLRRKVK